MKYAAAIAWSVVMISPALAEDFEQFGPSVYEVYREPESHRSDVTQYQGPTYVTRSPGCELYCVDNYYNPLTGANGSFVSSPR